MNRLDKCRLLVGWAAVACSYLVLIRSPATGYELSIYRSTPIEFWISVGAAFPVAIHAVVVRSGWVRRNGIAIGVFSTTAVTSIPYLRRYYFYGEYDSLNHLGTVKDFQFGSILPSEILYPGQHLFAGSINLVTGLGENKSLLLLVSIFVVLFAISSPLVTRKLTADDESYATAWIVSLLVLPVLVVRIPRLEPTPTFVALSFIPVCFLAFFHFLSERSFQNKVMVIVTLVGITLFHPQQAATFVAGLLLLSATAVCFAILTDKWELLGSKYRQCAIVSLIGATIVALWLSEQRGFSGAVANIIVGLMSNPDGSGATPDTTNAETVGVSIVEILLKVFTVEMLSVVIVFVTGLALVHPKMRQKVPVRSGLVLPFAVTCVPAGAFLAVFFLIGAQSQFVRYGSYVLVIVTFTLPIGLCWLSRTVPLQQRATAAIGVVLFVLVVITVPAFHPSPYIYQSNPQVTEGQVVGYENTFEYQEENTSITGLRTSVYRHRNAIYGKAVSERGLYGMDRHDEVINPKPPGTWRLSKAAPHFNDQNLSAWTDRNAYVVTTEGDYRERVELYGGLTYTEEDFQYLDRDHRISKIITNDEVDVYYVQSG